MFVQKMTQPTKQEISLWLEEALTDLIKTKAPRRGLTDQWNALTVHEQGLQQAFPSAGV